MTAFCHTKMGRDTLYVVFAPVMEEGGRLFFGGDGVVKSKQPLGR